MNEFIEKLIGRLEELANYNGNAYLDSADVFDEINELAEEHNGGWIPCSERLPEEDGRYLVTWKEDWGNGRYEYFVFKAEYARGDWSIQEKDERYNSSVIAWQPLPQPYNPKEE